MLNVLKNRYKILQKLSQGGFGETFLAEDTLMPSARRCVIKQLKPIEDDPQIYETIKGRFQREAAILEQLGEGNRQIPSLYAYFEENDLFYLVQEWIEGVTLVQKIRAEGLLSENKVKEILISVLPVLDFIHSQRIVHRDIKPDNIILRPPHDLPVLIDFGAVKETMNTTVGSSGDNTRSIAIGTPGYMPSEQSAGRPVYSSDLYSLGLTAIYLLTGKIPQQLPTDPSNGDYLWRQYVPNLSSGLASIIDRSIQFSPRDRYSTAREMLEALQGTPSYQPIITPPTIHSPPVNRGDMPTAITNASQQNSYPASSSPIYQPPGYSAPSNTGMKDWQRAVLTGSIIGVFVMGALLLNTYLSKFGYISQNNTAPTATPTTSTQKQTSNTSTPTTSNNLSLSKAEAKAVIEKWQNYKTRLFGSSYDRSLASEILTGNAYYKNIQRSDGQESSVDWLQNRGQYYIYGMQSVDAINNIEIQGNFATLQVVTTEEISLYRNNGQIDSSNSGWYNNTYRYKLLYENGIWKIADYNKIL
jgi:serine/threonine-protein kinase